jgi:chromosome segregation ATPase
LQWAVSDREKVILSFPNFISFQTYNQMDKATEIVKNQQTARVSRIPVPVGNRSGVSPPISPARIRSSISPSRIPIPMKYSPRSGSPVQPAGATSPRSYTTTQPDEQKQQKNDIIQSKEIDTHQQQHIDTNSSSCTSSTSEFASTIKMDNSPLHGYNQLLIGNQPSNSTSLYNSYLLTKAANDKERHSSPSVLYTFTDNSERPTRNFLEIKSPEHSVASTISTSTLTTSLPSSKISLSDKGSPSATLANNSKLANPSILELKVKSLEIDKDELIKELDDLKSFNESVEHENKALREHCSKCEVDQSSYQLMIVQLEKENSQLKNRLQMQPDKGQNEVEMSKLIEELAQVVKDKEMLSKKYSNIQKEHSMCAADDSGLKQQVKAMSTELRIAQDRVKHLEDLLNNEKQYKTIERDEQPLKEASKKLEEMKKLIAIKDEQLNRKDGQMSLVQGEMNKMKADLKNAVMRSQSLTLEIERLRNESKLTESREETDNMVAIKELKEKLAKAEREMREKDQWIEKELKGIKQIEISGTACKRKNKELEEQLVLKNEALSKREKEIEKLTIEKETLDVIVGERESELRSAQIMKGQEISELNGLVATLKAKNSTLNESIEEKEEMVKKLTFQNKSLQRSLQFEKDSMANSTDQIAQLKEENQRLRKNFGELEIEKNRISEDAQNKAVASNETEMNVRLHLEAAQVENKSKENQLHEMTIQMTKKEADLEKAQGKISDQQTQISLLNADITNYKELIENLETKLKRQQEMRHQEIGELRKKFEEKQKEEMKFASQVKLLQSEVNQRKEVEKKDKEMLQKFKKTCEELQAQLQAGEVENVSLKARLTQAEERVGKLEANLKDRKAQLQATEEAAHSLTAQLEDTERKLQHTERLNNEERNHFTESMGTTSVQHKKEMTKLMQQIESMQVAKAKLEEALNKEQAILMKTNAELTNISDALRKREDECKMLHSSIEKEVSQRNEITSQLALLQTTYNEIQSEKKEMEASLGSSQSELRQSQGKLRELQNQHVSLEQEMKVQREISESSLKRMEEKGRELVMNHENKVKELKNNLIKMEGHIQDLTNQQSQMKKELDAVKSHNAHYQEQNGKLNNQLSEKTTVVNYTKQKLDQLEENIKQEKLTRVQTQESLMRELARRQDLVKKNEQLKEKLGQVNTTKATLEELIKKERDIAVSLKERINELEMISESLRGNFQKEKELRGIDKQNTEADKAAMKNKFKNEIKILKETLSTLQSEITILRNTVEVHIKEAASSERALKNAEQDKEKMREKRVELEKELSEAKEQLRVAEMNIKSQDVHLTHMKSEIDSLQQKQLDYEEYKKSIETKQRNELQKILSEVTEHMEQQYTAHSYLEKLRADNETLAIKEKDRKIGHLKNELKAQKKELKKEKLQVETLAMEAQYLKTRQKEHEKSKQMVESRLERVSDMLSSTIVGRSAASSPNIKSSTPINKK